MWVSVSNCPTKQYDSALHPDTGEHINIISCDWLHDHHQSVRALILLLKSKIEVQQGQEF